VFSGKLLSKNDGRNLNPGNQSKSAGESHLWVVSEYFHPCDNATGQIMTVIAGMLSKIRGVNVITTTRRGVAAGIVTPGLEVFRIKDSSLNKNSLFQRPLRIMLLSLRLFFKILRLVKRNDTVISVTNPTLLTFLLKFGKMIGGFKIILIVHDVFPENMVATGIMKKTNPFFRIIRRGFQNALDSFDAVVVIGRDMEQIMKPKIRNTGKIHYLPNFAETGRIKPVEKRLNPIIREFGLENKLVILFTGNIGRAQHIDFICMLLLKMASMAEVHFLFIGDGAMKAPLENFIRDNGLSNATLMPAMARNRENIFLNAGDIGLVSLKPGLKGLGVPSKTYSYMAAAKPILAMVEPGSEIDIMVKEHNIGWSIDPLDLEQCVRTILSLKHGSDEMRMKGETARKTCEKFHTPEVYVANLIAIINSI